MLSAAPSAWFGFDTAQSVGAFWLQQIGATAVVLLGGTLGYGLVFMAAEGLSRRAFGHQPQLWRVWSRDGGSSVEIAGRTIGGYLFVPLELAFVVTFYYATNRWLGWWQPSEALTDPNILSAARCPRSRRSRLSLQAGFMEECACSAPCRWRWARSGRAVRRVALGIALAVVLQAVVFGGAHANYPGFPAYSRLVELSLPSLLWALIFLRYGLLPTIMLHALFDLSLMAMPLFLLAAPGAGMQQALVIAAALVPLAVVGVRRVQAGSLARTCRAALRNAAWRPGRARRRPSVRRRPPAMAVIGARTTALQHALPCSRSPARSPGCPARHSHRMFRRCRSIAPVR